MGCKCSKDSRHQCSFDGDIITCINDTNNITIYNLDEQENIPYIIKRYNKNNLDTINYSIIIIIILIIFIIKFII